MPIQVSALGPFGRRLRIPTTTCTCARGMSISTMAMWTTATRAAKLEFVV